MDYQSTQKLSTTARKVDELQDQVQDLYNRVRDMESLLTKLMEEKANAKRQRNSKPSRQ